MTTERNIHVFRRRGGAGSVKLDEDGHALNIPLRCAATESYLVLARAENLPGHTGVRTEKKRSSQHLPCGLAMWIKHHKPPRFTAMYSTIKSIFLAPNVRSTKESCSTSPANAQEINVQADEARNVTRLRVAEQQLGKLFKGHKLEIGY